MKNTKDKYLRSMGFELIKENSKYPSCGMTYRVDNEDFKGIYWFYETDDFIINIHDFFVQSDQVIVYKNDLKQGKQVSISNIKLANGEFLDPYRTLCNNMLYVYFHDQKPYKLLLHKGFPFFAVGYEYKEKYLEEFLPNRFNIPIEEIHNALETLRMVDSSLEIDRISNEIISSKNESGAALLFYEVKAKEVLSIALNKYFEKQKSESKLLYEDKIAIENVKRYIDNHYAMDIPQSLLAKIAMMSKSKLKKEFKIDTQMSITEYIQRKRISIAEHLLISTDLNIKNIAISVGYNSHGRFSELFKKYKGISPKEFKNMTLKSQ